MRFWGERSREQLAQGAWIDFRTFFCRCAGRPRHTRNFGNAPLRERCAAFFARRLAEQRDARTSIFVRPVQVLRGFTRIDVLRRDRARAAHAHENRTRGAPKTRTFVVKTVTLRDRRRTLEKPPFRPSRTAPGLEKAAPDPPGRPRNAPSSNKSALAAPPGSPKIEKLGRTRGSNAESARRKRAGSDPSPRAPLPNLGFYEWIYLFILFI